MGIKQLLPFVKKACREGSILELKGTSVAVDVSCLLHKGLFGCMEQFAQGQDTKFYLFYVKKYVQFLLDMSCHVIMVFDGRPLPAKKDTNDERRQRRQENMKAGEVLMSQGKKDEAVAKFQQAVSITQEIVDTTIEFFRKMKNVDVIVSPYESDAQLAFLTKEGFADAVITEDSDLIAFGCKKIIFKWNGDKMDCTIYERRLLPECFAGEMRTNFDFTKFRRICILSGCDYLQNGLPGIGLTKAQKFFMKTSQTDLAKVLPRIPSYLNEKKLKVPASFIDEFIRAENTFLHQIVFDPRQRCQRPLNPYPTQKQEKENIDDDDEFVKKPPKKESYHYAGSVVGSSLSVRLALGNSSDGGHLNDKFLLPSNIPEWSIWSDSFESGGKRKERIELEEKKKKKQCGVFTIDSPVKKRKRPLADENEEILIEDSPEKTKTITPKSPIIKRISTKKIRNEPEQLESIDELMRIYCSEEITVQTTVAVATSSQNTASEITVPSDLDATPSSSQDESADISVPAPKRFSSEPVGKVKPSLGSKPLGKSPYFMGRSAGCSNPFRKPSLNSPSQSPASSPIVKKEENKKSLLSVLDEDETEAATSSQSPLMGKRFGFKAPGLRKAATK